MMTLLLKIFTLNCWGIPLISRDRAARMQAIADMLAKSDYDLVSLQEVWSSYDYALISDKVKKNLPYSHYFFSGVFGSGLCVFSKYPIQEVFFHQWPINGYIHKFHHGDWFGGKGVGLVRLQIRDFHINFYATHLHAEYDRNCDEYVAHRVLQAYDTAQFIRLTEGNADIAILAGDLNTEPGDLAYRILCDSSRMVDSYNNGSHEDVKYTNERCQNSYTDDQLVREKYPGKRIDYIMFRELKQISVSVKNYNHPFPERIPSTGISYSDHEAVTSHLELSQPKTGVSSSSTNPNKNKYKEQDTKYETSKKVITESMTVLDEAIFSLSQHKRFYMILFITLFCLLLTTVNSDAPLGLTKIYYILRVIVTGGMFFALLMGTLWNNIEYHAVLACKMSMEHELNRMVDNRSDGIDFNLF